MNIILLVFIGILFFIFVLFLFVYIYFQYSFKYWSKRNVPHLKPSFPFGNFNSEMTSMSGIILKDIYNELKKTGASFGGLYLLNTPLVMPLTPEMLKYVFIKNFNNFHDTGMHYDEEIEPMSAILVALEGEKWEYLKKKLTPTFSPAKIKILFNIMKEKVKDILSILETEDKLDIYDIATRYTTDITCSCAFGIEANSLKNSTSEIMKYGLQLTHLNFCDNMRFLLAIKSPKILKMLKTTFLKPEIANFFHNIVKETIEYRETNNVQRNDLMDSLIRLKNNKPSQGNENEKKSENDGLTLNQIAAQILFFYWAGFDTTANALTCCLYELAKHQDIQKKVRQEILMVVKKHEGEIQFESINEMHYMDKVLRETLRKYPPVVQLDRICTETFFLPESKATIEKGTRLVISTLGLHHDPEYYPNPDKFDPERFSEEEISKRPPMTYLPFGDGPRICLGRKFAMIELKLALVTCLKDYRYHVHPSTNKNIKIGSCANLLKLRDKIWLKTTKI